MLYSHEVEDKIPYTSAGQENPGKPLRALDKIFVGDMTHEILFKRRRKRGQC